MVGRSTKKNLLHKIQPYNFLVIHLYFFTCCWKLWKVARRKELGKNHCWNNKSFRAKSRGKWLSCKGKNSMLKYAHFLKLLLASGCCVKRWRKVRTPMDVIWTMLCWFQKIIGKWRFCCCTWLCSRSQVDLMTADEKSALENELCRCSSIDYCSAERIFFSLEWRCHLSVFSMQLCKIGLRPTYKNATYQNGLQCSFREKNFFLWKKTYSWQISICMLLWL